MYIPPISGPTTARGPRLAVVGSAMIELFPAHAGQTLSDVKTLAFGASGSATIVAAAAAKLGADASIVTAVGADELGAEWSRRVAAAGVDVRAVVSIPGQRTPLAISSVDRNGAKSYSFYRFRGICDPLDELRLSEEFEAEIASAVVIITEASIRGPGSRSVVQSLLERRRPGRGLTVFSINYRPAAWEDAGVAAEILSAFASLVDVVCCNRAEYQLLSGRGREAELIFETLGSEGVEVHSAGASQLVAGWPAPGGVVLDTGAGDTFCAAVAVALGEGQRPLEAARFATAVAALAISREGMLDAVPAREEVEALLGLETASQKRAV